MANLCESGAAFPDGGPRERASAESSRLRPKQGRRRGTHLDATGTAQLHHRIGVSDGYASPVRFRDQTASNRRLRVARDHDAFHASPLEMLLCFPDSDGASV